ncbi:MAG: twin transmembrane helix small protein [Burkholderiaceae bacterium]|nr:twin transmembrane helix small protein [Burkholderiaceae bacterium]
MKVLVALAFVAIIGSLAVALIYMMRGGRDPASGDRRKNRMAHALAFRVGFSILLFVCVLIAWKLGYIQPTGLPASR